MPRFYFHLHNDLDVVDEEGRELPDLRAARAWAELEARNMAGESARESGQIVLHHRVDIADGQGVVLDSVFFGDAVEIKR